MDWLISFCILFLGADDWETRQRAQEVVEWLTIRYDCPGPLRRAVKESDDIEIRKRCERALWRYEWVDVPACVFMRDFLPPANKTLWDKANKLAFRRDVLEYGRLLVSEGGMTRREVEAVVEKAKWVRMQAIIKDKMDEAKWVTQVWLQEQWSSLFPPPPMYPEEGWMQ